MSLSHLSTKLIANRYFVFVKFREISNFRIFEANRFIFLNIYLFFIFFIFYYFNYNFRSALIVIIFHGSSIDIKNNKLYFILFWNTVSKTTPYFPSTIDF